MHVDKIGRRNEFVIPDFLEQHRPCQHLVAPLHHIFQQAKLARQEVDHAIAPSDGARDQIELERPCPQRRLARFRRTAQQRLDSCKELDECERFGEVVVAAHPQSAYAVVDRTERAQHQHRRAHLVFPQRLDHRKAVHPRQQPIDDHGIGPQRARLVEALDAVGGPFDLKAAIGDSAVISSAVSLSSSIRSNFAIG